MKSGKTVPTATYRTLLEVADAFHDAFVTVSKASAATPNEELVISELKKLVKLGCFALLEQAKYLSDNLAPTRGQKIYHP